MGIERNDYLKLCQLSSTFEKCKVPSEILVTYDGVEYVPRAYEMAFDEKGNTINRAILYDVKANCIVYAKLERVEKNDKR